MGLFNSGSTLASVVASLVSFINLLIWVTVPLAFVVFFYGLVKYIYKSGDAQVHEEARETILWSLIVLFVMFSIWGILTLLNTSFFGGNVSAPTSISPSYYSGSGGASSSGTTGAIGPGPSGGLY